MVHIGLIGYGVVGQGTAEILHKNAAVLEKRAGVPLRIKRILTSHTRSKDPLQYLITQTPSVLFDDPDISVIAEAVNDLEAAYTYCKQALSSGRHYVTSNKNLIAAYGPELTRLANENNVSLMYEASVAGGVPVIRPLYTCLAGSRINAVGGILNGTANFILSAMEKGHSFAEALDKAQQLGYAESDPAADVEGLDSVRKLAILASIAFGEYIDYRKLSAEGITQLESADIALAAQLGHRIKLVARALRLPDGEIQAHVCPMLVPHENMLSRVEGVSNAVEFSADMAGHLLFHGNGAGSLATGSAMVSDIVDIVRGGRYPNSVWGSSHSPLGCPGQEPCGLFVRSPLKELRKLQSLYPGAPATRMAEEAAILTPRGKEQELRKELKQCGIVTHSVLRTAETTL